MRVKYAVAIETVTTEWGSIKISQAIAAAATEATACPEPRSTAAVDATAVCTSPPICETTTIASDHDAALSAGPRPNPRHLKFRLSFSPIRFQLTRRIRACAATPAVALPASSAIWSAPQELIDLEPVGSAEKIRMKRPSPRSETKLFSTGAHINGPKAFLELSTSPSIE